MAIADVKPSMRSKVAVLGLRYHAQCILVCQPSVSYQVDTRIIGIVTVAQHHSTLTANSFYTLAETHILIPTMT